LALHDLGAGRQDGLEELTERDEYVRLRRTYLRSGDDLRERHVGLSGTGS
jgi:hypothetical protein